MDDTIGPDGRRTRRRRSTNPTRHSPKGEHDCSRDGHQSWASYLDSVGQHRDHSDGDYMRCKWCGCYVCCQCQAVEVESVLMFCEECSLADEAMAEDIDLDAGTAMCSAAARSGQRWNSDEDGRVLAAFRTGQSVPQIADALKRSEGAIWTRLVRLGETDWSRVPDRFAPRRSGA